ncbi:heavy-metal-associated domain-containing protein [Agromyces archimandritae]|uniref:Heavy-metal-associated domain-containing protein n=1 Tax=Agromyces archimandritae TaxID=2781962 RepID=A0A975FKC1_9MICO|nr:cation transporter [Agromyces archimandritae]QTX03362.1 heavy-metal-associated domain-containing protein [Agromyces archimandritae]
MSQPTTATADYLVEGMTCSHCVASVSEELGELAGVSAVSVDLVADGASRVTVSADAAPSDDDVRQAVETAGYRFAGRA